MNFNILLVGTIYPPDSGGPATFIEEFAKWLVANGNNVTVLATSAKRTEPNKIEKINLKLVWRSWLPLRLLKFSFFLRKEAKKVDVILAVGGFIETYLATRLLNSRVYYKVPGDIVWERARNKGYTALNISEFQNSRIGFSESIVRFLQSKALRESNGVIVPSYGLKEICLQWGVSNSKLRVIHNSVSPLFSINSIQNKKIKYDVVTVCRLTPWKGVDQLIRVCSDLKLNLLVIGEGPELEKLKVLASSLKSNVEFVGQIETREVSDYLRMSKLMVLNSSYEGLPHALIEARQMGCIAISRLGTGSEEVITNEVNGYLTDGTSEDLKSNIQKGLLDNHKNRVIIENGYRDNLERFDQTKNFMRILEVLIGM